MSWGCDKQSAELVVTKLKETMKSAKQEIKTNFTEMDLENVDIVEDIKDHFDKMVSYYDDLIEAIETYRFE